MQIQELIADHSLKNDCLRYIVHRELQQTNLRDFEKNYNRDLIIGLIGDRGSGKTISGAQIVVRDYMARGEPCFSNIGISPRFSISDESVSYWCGDKYSIDTGGIVQYNAVPLDIYKFLQFSEEYSNGVIFLDEINIALADARRSMSYQNLGSADVGQQLRKLKSALVYTCINEAYVDIRIRDLTDFFINTRDAAYVNDGIPHKREGHFFHWSIYPMTDKAAAIMGTYQKYTGKRDSPPPIPHTISGHSWWDTFNTWEHQERRKYKAGVIEASSVGDSIRENPAIVVSKQDWGWLESIANHIVELGQQDNGLVPCYEVMSWPEVQEHGLPQNRLSKELNRRYSIWTKPASIKDGGGRKVQQYVVADAILGQ